MTIDNIKEEIQKANDVVILTHESPDGDAVGSALAMYLTLKKLGKTVDVIIPEYASMFNFLPGADQIKKVGKQEPYDLAISVDVTGVNRLIGFSKYFEDANVKMHEPDFKGQPSHFLVIHWPVIWRSSELMRSDLTLCPWRSLIMTTWD